MTATGARPVPPWWRVLTVGDEQSRQVEHVRRTGPEPSDPVAVRHLRGRRTATLTGLFREFAAGWQFPEYYGHNWPALEDCLTDLAWAPAPGYLCVIDLAEALLENERPVTLAILTDLLNRVGEYWAAPIALGEPWDRPAKAFHTVLLADTPAGAGRLRDRLHAAGVLDER